MEGHFKIGVDDAYSKPDMHILEGYSSCLGLRKEFPSYISHGIRSGISVLGECHMLKPMALGGWLEMNNPMDNLEIIHKQFIEKYVILLLPEVSQSYSPSEFYGDAMELLMPQMLWNSPNN